MASETVARFKDHNRIVLADTCEPLKTAAARGELSLSAWGHGLYPGQSFPADLLPEVRSAGVWNASKAQQWGLEAHCNEGLEFSFIERGQLGYRVGNEHWQLHTGHLTISRPWQMHSVGDPLIAASRFHWLILDVGVRRPNQDWHWPKWLVCSPRDIERLTKLLRHNETPVWQASSEIKNCFKRIAATLELHSTQQDAEQVAARLKLHVNSLLIALLELLETQEMRLDERLTSSYRAVQLFLGQLGHQLEQAWTLERMSLSCGLGRSQFARYCAQITNLTPLEYLTHRRLERAARLLCDQPDLAITEIGARCGFHSSQYFTNAFRMHQGCSPSAYRQRLRSTISAVRSGGQ